MKKYISLIIVLFLCIIVSGCKKKYDITTCKSTNKQEKYTIETKYTIESTKGIVEKVKLNQTIKSDNEEVLKDFEKNQKEQYGINKSLYGGYTYDINIKNKKVIINVTIDYTKIKMKKLLEDNVAMKKYVDKNNKFTLEKAKKLYQVTGNKCE